MIRSSRHIHTKIDGTPFEPVMITDDETCLVISNTTRVAVIKLLGSFSRDAYTQRGLNEREIVALETLYRTAHT